MATLPALAACAEREVGGQDAVSGALYRSQSRPLFNTSDAPPPASDRGVYTPATGTRERSELMDAVRVATREDFGTLVVFRVFNLRADGEWAFAQLSPQHPDGQSLDPAITPLYRDRAVPRPSSALQVDVIWRRDNDRWQVHAHRIGSTDAWWLRHCGDGPGQVIPGC